MSEQIFVGKFKKDDLTHSEALMVAKQIASILILNGIDASNDDDVSISENDSEKISICLKKIGESLYREDLGYCDVKYIINKVKKMR